jgi:hypothetical protein
MTVGKVMPIPVRADPLYMYLLDPLERAGRTFAQVFLVAVLGVGPLLHMEGQVLLGAFLSALFAALISFFSAQITNMAGLIFDNGWDVLIRVTRTFLTTLLGVMSTTGVTTFVDVNWIHAIDVSLAAAAVSFLNSIAKLADPNTIGGSTLAARVRV